MKHTLSRAPIPGIGIAFAIFLGVSILSSSTPAQNAAGAPATTPPAEERVDFNWDVRPILSENCLRCHGPSESSRQAGLRLDVAASAYAELANSPGKHAIVPGKPDDSELVKRITHADVAQRMPPPQANKVLTEAQIDVLKKWIAQGAEYKPHWAFVTPERVAPPQVKTTARVINDIDRFVLAKLEREGLSLSPQADKETLINRVSLTLTGLPPPLAEVDSFLRDNSATAYDKVVDRLLASPAYGEHMASYWMDLARWAESDGFLDDHHHRLLWPWRDWVIGAFNTNMPFDQFSTRQLAGDLLPNRTKDDLVATTFLRLGKRTTENGAIGEEYRVEYVVDRTDTVGQAFLGLTVGCARCHTHKYDPITHQDYYSLSGFFNSADEPGFYPPGFSGIQAGPTLPWPDKGTEAKIAAATATIARRDAAYQAARIQAEKEGAAAVEHRLAGSATDVITLVRSSVAAKTVAYYPFDETAPIVESQLPPDRVRSTLPSALAMLNGPQLLRPGGVPVPPAPVPQAEPNGNPSPNGLFAGAGFLNRYGLVRADSVMSASGLPGGTPAVLQAPILRDGVKGKALFFDDVNRGVVANNVGRYDRTQEFSLDLWFYVGQKYEFAANEVYKSVPILNHRDSDTNGSSGYQLLLEDNHLSVYLAHSIPANMIAIKSRKELPARTWAHITLTYDGSSRAAGLKLYLDGQLADIEVDHDTLTRSMLPMGYNPTNSDYLGLMFGTRFREKAPTGSALDELRVFNRALTPIEVGYLHREDGLVARDAQSLRRELLDLRVANDARVVEAKRLLDDAREAENTISVLVPQLLVFGDTPRPRPTHRLDRGLYSEPREQVPVRGLIQIFPWDPALPGNRLGLAKWLFDPKHPLTSRVFVNRMWQMHFGQGLVETAEDFGMQGAIPTHRELLDWLATSFRDSGWNIKQLHRLIVTSAAYRQASTVSDDLLQKDPGNLLLARRSRPRMSAEMIRDHALAASGLLVRRVGGPSVHPYQPANVWNEDNTFYRYPAPDTVPAEEHHRRSLYTFIKRNAVHPGMQLFDFADRSYSKARRRTSNTPLQALVLLNDPQFAEAYRVLATGAFKSAPNTTARLTRLFRLATSRQPTADEVDILREFYEQQQMQFAADTAKAKALLNIGVTPVDAAVDAVELAALTTVTALVMNAPDAYTIR